MRLALALAALALPTLALADPVKVFILAGQSNMVGQVQNKLLEFQSTDAKTSELFAHLRDDEGWLVRDDVFIKFRDRLGGLSIGYGSPNRTGVELEFGNVMGEHFDQPVLLIKSAAGGHSLFKNFRPPSAGLPEAAFLDQELANAQKRTTENNEKNNRHDPLPTREDIEAAYGQSYRELIAEVKDTIASCGELFPELADKEIELSGLVWFQGWNDQYNGAELQYAANMKHFIEDVRKDLGTPDLPVVIGVMGQNGSSPAAGAMLTIQEAQLATEQEPAFKGNVRSIRTDLLIDTAAEELYPTWKDNVEEWEKVGSDHPYHYLGSAIWHLRMGKAFAHAMLELMGEG
jgi:hypothetical protein